MKDNHQFCQECGERLEKNGLFCSNCGTPAPKDTSSITWDFDIPFLDPFVLQGVAKAFGIPIFFLFCLFGYFALDSNTSFDKFMEINGAGLYFTAILLGITVLLAVLVLAIVYKGKYSAQFTVNNQGAAYETQAKQRQVNSTINFLLIFAGLFSGKPGYAGTGLLAQASQSAAVEWNQIHRITPYPQKRIIVLHDSWHKALILYCTADNYEAVLHVAQAAVAQAGEIRQQTETVTKKTSFKWLWKLLAGLLILTTIVFLGFEAYDYLAPSKKNNTSNTTMEDYLQSSAKLSKSLETSLLNIGNAESVKGNYDKAIENADNVINLNPNNINAYFTRGNGYYGKKEYTKALTDYTTILKLDPNNTTAFYNRGLTYQVLGNIAKAKEDYQKAAEQGYEKAKVKLDYIRLSED